MTQVLPPPPSSPPEGKILPEIKVSEEYENFVSPLSPEEFIALVQDIREHGQKVPGIVNQDGVILDGHHRYKACKEAGKPYSYQLTPTKDKADEIAFIISVNVNRRHMTAWQRAELALKAKVKLEAIARENMSLGGKGVRVQTPIGRSDEQAAKMVGSKRNMMHIVSSALKIVGATPEQRLEFDYDGRYRGSEGSTYSQLLGYAQVGKPYTV